MADNSMRCLQHPDADLWADVASEVWRCDVCDRQVSIWTRII